MASWRGARRGPCALCLGCGLRRRELRGELPAEVFRELRGEPQGELLAGQLRAPRPGRLRGRRLVADLSSKVVQLLADRRERSEVLLFAPLLFCLELPEPSAERADLLPQQGHGPLHSSHLLARRGHLAGSVGDGGKFAAVRLGILLRPLPALGRLAPRGLEAAAELEDVGGLRRGSEVRRGLRQGLDADGPLGRGVLGQAVVQLQQRLRLRVGVQEPQRGEHRGLRLQGRLELFTREVSLIGLVARGEHVRHGNRKRGPVLLNLPRPPRLPRRPRRREGVAHGPRHEACRGEGADRDVDDEGWHHRATRDHLLQG
mmetsp:Transcript_7574/g.18033  ORF Transcript_7574/g.18033 Transcript_7574/m.18033 type:complete len:316 (-) Transcript_7574:969-1916(-)